MPLRDPTPEELKELGVPMAAPTAQAALATPNQEGVDYRALSSQMSQQASNTSNPLTYYHPPATTMDKVVLGMGPAMATTMLGGGLLKGAIPAVSKFAPYAEPVGQGLGNAALEGFNYLTQPEESKPTVMGASLRTGAQMAIPLGLGKLGEAVAPLTQRIKPMLSKIPAQSKEVLGQLGSSIKTVVNSGIRETTKARLIKDAMLADLEAKGVRLPLGPVIQALKDKIVPFADQEMNSLVNMLQKVAEPLDNSISLVKFQEIIRAARRNAKLPAAKDAFAAFNDEFKNSVASHIAQSGQGGPVMAQEFLDTFDETASRLKIFEDMQKVIGGSDPAKQRKAINIVQGLYFDDTAKQMLKALDNEIKLPGGGFLPQVEKLAKEASAIERRIAERGMTAEANAALQLAQRRARNILYTLLPVPGISRLLAGLLNKFAAEPWPIERAVATGLGAAGKAAPATTATVNQVTRDYE